MNRPVEILLVEDNPGDVRLAQEVLFEGSVRKNIAVVSDGAEAIDYLRRRGRYNRTLRPDIVLLDLNLPKRDGLEVLREIKSDPVLRAITVIVLTTSQQARDINSAYDLAANCYIVKPIGLDEFYSVMRGIEEFWMSMAALPTFDLDPMPSSLSEDGQTAGSKPDKTKGSAGAGSRAWRSRRSPRPRRSGWPCPIRGRVSRLDGH